MTSLALRFLSVTPGELSLSPLVKVSLPKEIPFRSTTVEGLGLVVADSVATLEVEEAVAPAPVMPYCQSRIAGSQPRTSMIVARVKIATLCFVNACIYKRMTWALISRLCSTSKDDMLMVRLTSDRRAS